MLTVTGIDVAYWLRRVALAAVCLSAGAATASAQDERFDCVMEPARLVEVGSPMVGILEDVLVKRGDRVEKGEVIARLRSEVETATVEIERVRSASTARIAAQRARVELNAKRLERASKLLKKEVVSTDRYDELVAELEFSKNELERETLELRLAELELMRSQVILQQRTIRSPIDGIVSERTLTAGEFIQQEGHIVTLAAMDPLHVEVFLPVDLYPKIRLGMIGTVEPAPPINGSYAAAVTVVDRVFDAASSSFGVRLALPNKNRRLPAGHRCKVSFPLNDHPPLLDMPPAN